MKTTNCKRCGKLVEKRGARKYCIACRKIVDKELAGRYVETHSKGKFKRKKKED